MVKMPDSHFEARLSEQLHKLQICINSMHYQELELVRSSEVQRSPKSNTKQCSSQVETPTRTSFDSSAIDLVLPVPARGLVSLGELSAAVNDPSTPMSARPSKLSCKWAYAKSNQTPSVSGHSATLAFQPAMSVPSAPPPFQGVSEMTNRSALGLPHPLALSRNSRIGPSSSNVYNGVESGAPLSRTLNRLIEEVEGMEMTKVNDYFYSWHCWPNWREHALRAKAWYAESSREAVFIAIVDVTMSFVIVLNCLLVGISLDMDEWAGWDSFEYTFVAIFVAEICIKIFLLGWRDMYFGEMWTWNLFDTLVVALAVGELFVKASGSVAVLRVVRLGRVLRLMRMVKLAAAQELVMLLHGMIGGARCLFWFLVALALPVYIAGMVLFQTFHDFFEDDGLFTSVPKAMFTTFRCMCGDCTDAQGRPIIVHLANSRGWYLALLYTLFILVTIFGFFNLITAIFVERTMQAARNDTVLQARIRKASDKKFARNIKRLVFMFWQAHEHTSKGQNHGGIYASETAIEKFNLSDALELEITQDFYDDVVRTPAVKEIFDDMDLRDDDIIDLFQILDVDRSGTLDVTELVNGIHKLRGDASKKDLVALAYMLYAMQDTIQLMGKDFANMSGRTVDGQNEELRRDSSNSFGDQTS